LPATTKRRNAVTASFAWLFVTQPEFAPWVIALWGQKPRPPRLSQPGLETLAIIAYRQPITRAEMEQIRGVAVDGVLQTLVERGLVEQAGRAEVVGRPMTYATTPLFLEYFGLRRLEDLPAADELRRIVVQKPEALLTVDPGLATAPPDELAQGEADRSAAAEQPSSPVQEESAGAPEAAGQPSAEEARPDVPS
jgi:segregation and condensation protein B